MEQNTQKIFRIAVDYQTANANLEEVKKKLKELHEASRELVRKQQELDRQFKDGKLSQAEYTNQTNANRQATALNRQSLTALNDEKRRSTLETNKLAISEKAGSGSMLQMQSRLIALRSEYRQLTEAQRNNAAVGGKLQREIEQLSNKYRKLEISIGNTSANVGNYIGAFSKMQGTFGMITAGLYAVKKAFQPFVDFEYQMDRVAAVSGATAEQFARLTEDAKRLGEATEYTASEVAELQLNYARLGFSPDEIIEVTQATLDLATATGEDLAKSADVAGSTLRGFRLDASQMPRVVDVMAASFNQSALSLDNFTESIKYVAPIAASAGVSLEQTTAMLGVLADAGIRGSMAGTAMRRILTEVATSGKPLNDALQELNKNGLTLQGSFDEVGRHAMTALNVLANGSGQVDSLTVALNDSAGAAKIAAEAMRDNLQGDVDKALSKLEGLAIWFGNIFSPILRGTVQLFTALLTPIKIATVAVAAWFVTFKAGTAVVNLYNAAKKGLKITTNASTASLISETAAMDASTMATKRNMVAIRNTTMATKAYAAIKLVLAGNFKAAALAAKMFFASLGPVGWLALGVGAVVGALAIFSDKTKEASGASAQMALELAQEKATYSDLRKAVMENAEGSKARAEAIRLINERYKEYLPNMLTEKMSNEEIAATLGVVNQKMEENIKIKIKAQEMQRIQQEQFDIEKAAIDKLIKQYNRLGDKTPDQIALAQVEFVKLFEKIKQTGIEIEDVNDLLLKFGSDQEHIDKIVRSSDSEAARYWRKINGILKDVKEQAEKTAGAFALLNAMIGMTGTKSIKFENMGLGQLNAELSRVNSMLGMTTALSTEQRKAFELDRDEIKKQIGLREQQIKVDNTYAGVLQRLKDEKTALEGGLGKITKDGKTEGEWRKAVATQQKLIDLKKDEIDKLEGKEKAHHDRSQQKEENAALKRAEFIIKQARKLEDMQSQMQDMEIAGYEDGLNKKLILSERAGQKEVTQQQRTHADLLAETDKMIKEIEAKEALLKKENEVLPKERKKDLPVEDVEQLKQLNDKKEQLMKAGGAVERAILAKNALARMKILKDASEKELDEFIIYQMKLKNYALASEADAILKKKKQDAHKAAIYQEQDAYAESVDLMSKQHALENAIIANSAATTKTQKKANQKAQLAEDARYANEQYEAYKKHLEDQKALGVEITGGMLQELNNLKDGAGNADTKAKTTTWLGDLLGMDDDQVEQLKQQAFQVASEIANTITQIGMQNSQRQLKVETERIDTTKKKELKALDERKRKGVLSDKQYEKQKEAIEKKAEKQKEQAERQAFEREKRYKMMQVAMEVALGIVRIWSENGASLFKIPFAIVQTAFLAATGIAQAAAIAASKYARGGVVDMYSDGPAASFGMIRGRSHASGGNQLSIDGKPVAEVEGNETLVILKRGSEAFAPILSEMNTSIGGRKFARGGVVRSPNMKIPAPAPLPRSLFTPTASMEVQIAGFRDEMRGTIQRLDTNIQAVNTRIDNIRVHLVETDVTEAQDSVRTIVQQATY